MKKCCSPSIFHVHPTNKKDHDDAEHDKNNDLLLRKNVPSHVTEVQITDLSHLPAQTFRKHNVLERLIWNANSSYSTSSSMGKEVCFGCGNLLLVTLPSTLEEISDHAFAYCRSLEHVEFGLSSFNSNSRLKVIGDGAFYYCELLKRIQIPDSVQIIKRHAFYGCQQLEEIEWPVNSSSCLELIGKEAFGYCHSLTHVLLPMTITNLGVNAFHCCARLQSIDINTTATTTTATTPASDSTSATTATPLALAIQLRVAYPHHTPNLSMPRLIRWYAKKRIKPSELLTSSPQENQTLLDIQKAQLESIHSFVLWCVTTAGLMDR